jgi:hypothetical protein
MSEKTDRIEADIQGRRDALRSNFDELEAEVKSVTDWRRHFARHPWAMMTAAIGAGALVATMVGRRGRGTASSPGEARASAGPPASGVRPRGGVTSQIWDPVRDALIGAAAMRAAGFLQEVLPGLQGHLKRSGAATAAAPRSFAERDNSKSPRGEGDREAGRGHRNDEEKLPKTGDLGPSAPEAAPGARQAAAETGASEAAAPRRASPA